MITVPSPASFPRRAAAAVIALSGCGGDSLPTYQAYVEGEFLYLAAPQAGYLKTPRRAPGQPCCTRSGTLRDRRRHNPEGISAYNVVPGLLSVILTMTMVLMTGLAMTRERERGTFEQLLATPAAPLEVITGKIVPYILIGLIVQVRGIMLKGNGLDMVWEQAWPILLFIGVVLAVGLKTFRRTLD